MNLISVFEGAFAFLRKYFTFLVNSFSSLPILVIVFFSILLIGCILHKVLKMVGRS